jgi:hypothetical protein
MSGYSDKVRDFFTKIEDEALEDLMFLAGKRDKDGMETIIDNLVTDVIEFIDENPGEFDLMSADEVALHYTKDEDVE